MSLAQLVVSAAVNFSGYLVKTEKKTKDSQQIMFFDVPMNKIADKEGGKFQNSLEMRCDTSELLFSENSIG